MSEHCTGNTIHNILLQEAPSVREVKWKSIASGRRETGRERERWREGDRQKDRQERIQRKREKTKGKKNRERGEGRRHREKERVRESERGETDYSSCAVSLPPLAVINSVLRGGGDVTYNSMTTL